MVHTVPARTARLLIGKTDFQEIHNRLMAEVLAVLENLSSYDPRAFTEANEAYLVKLFPEQSPPEKPNGNGDELVEELEPDVE